MGEYLIKLKDVLRILDVVMSDDSIKHKGKAIRKRLAELPPADVEKVVRCKDCKWWANGELCRNVNGLNSIVWNGEWFCASGQRKEGAEE